ncbi:MAG: lysine--tRNA ligase [Acidobacteriia bacterium]|nr:lysine--tRNA ligase [Terriglobia bacterium]
MPPRYRVIIPSVSRRRLPEVSCNILPPVRLKALIVERTVPLEFEPLDQFLQRRKKLSEIESLGHAPYPHKFAWTHTARQVAEQFGHRTADQLSSERVEVRVAGRIVALRPHGKAAFAHLAGDGARLQMYIKLDVVGEQAYKLFQLLDLGDIVGVSGHLFRTKTNELTVWVEGLELLNKALLPLPEKWHGLADVEMRYRRRYLDLIVNERAREIFLRRAQITRELRRFFDERGYVEVETPMMHSILGGATARPFVTHHNTFDMDLFLRIAPELYLKRLVVGGLDRVYEINRNFRNEGIDAIHQPEFTMLEFYQAYSDALELMDLTEELLRGLAEKVCGSAKIKYGEREIDFSHFERLSMRDAIHMFWPTAAGAAPSVAELARKGGPRGAVARYNAFARSGGGETIDDAGTRSDGELTGDLFEAVAEGHLIQPTFIYDFPTEISPLAKRREDDPSLTERFELFIAGMEIANGFSELNDPADQERRFRAQVEKGGHDMPKEVDTDYIRALSHGLPPTAGEGIGIDRLVMLLTDSHAIREVILFPLLRAEAPEGTSAEKSAGEGEPPK